MLADDLLIINKAIKCLLETSFTAPVSRSNTLEITTRNMLVSNV